LIHGNDYHNRGGPLKLKFKNQTFQTDAVAAVADLFRGQEKRQDTFTITNEQQLNLDAGLGVGNVLTIGGADGVISFKLP